MNLELVYPGVWKLSFGLPSSHTPVAFRSKPPAAGAFLPPAERPPLDCDAIRFEATRRGCRLELPHDASEDLYGLGLQLKSFRQTGKKKQLRPNSDPIADLGDSHAPVPFYLSTAGYGVLIDTARYAVFYCGTHHDRQAAAAAESPVRGLADSTEALYAAPTESGDPVTVEIPHEKGVELYLFAGPAMRDALCRYVLFSGGGALPPLWGLGIFYRGYVHNDEEGTLRLARQLRESQMPCDVFGLEPGWQSHSYSCSFVWDRQRFPAPDRLAGEMRKLGFELNLWEHPFTHPAAPFHADIAPFSGSVEVWNGLVPDFATPEGRELYGAYHRKTFLERGITGFKIDECDHSDYIASDWSFPEYAGFPSGLDGEEMHSLFGLLSQQVLLEECERTGIRTWSNVRNTQALAAPLPFTLYSDLYDHRDFLRGLVNSGLSGLLWTPEVRQCQSEADLIRRLQLVIFSPMALINGWMIKNPPWLQFDVERNNRDELHEDREAITARCRDILELRMRLVPYLYSAFARYRIEGVPPFRPLVVDYPDDPTCRNIDDELLVGDHLLLAPLTAEMTVRTVYLPAGNWYDYRTGERFAGSRTLEIRPALEEIPLFVKEGTLMPWARSVEHITPATRFQLEPRCYGRAVRPFRLYDGDGFQLEPPLTAWVELLPAGNGQPVRLSQTSRLYGLMD